MKKQTVLVLRVVALLALVGLVIGLLTACGGSEAPATTAPALPATVDGAALLETRCSTCHSVSKATGETHTQAEWDQIVSQMIQKGAKLDDVEKAALVEYLTATYGK